MSSLRDSSRRVLRNGKASLPLKGRDTLRWVPPVSPFGSSVLAYAALDRTKTSNLSIISFTVTGTLSEKRLTNSDDLTESMNDEIFITSGTPMIKPVSTVHLSLNVVNDSLALLTILVISCGSLKHALLTEYLATNASLNSAHSLMLS
ncbi:hypothetical protein Tco_0956722 [Tanacetum coccineum]